MSQIAIELIFRQDFPHKKLLVVSDVSAIAQRLETSARLLRLTILIFLGGME